MVATAGFERDVPATVAMTRILRRLLDTMEANVAGTLADSDPEHLHDLRVAVRRTRTALKLAGAALPGVLAAQYGSRFRWLGTVTTPMRDLDVQLAELPALADASATGTLADLGPLREALCEQRWGERRLLLRHLRGARFAELRTGWRRVLDATESHADGVGRGTGQRVEKFAAKRIDKAYRRVLQRGQAITVAAPAERLHDVRKRGKELRYLLEFFQPWCEPTAHAKVVRDLKSLQNVLGRFQDGHVQAGMIAQFAPQLDTDGQAGRRTGAMLAEVRDVLGARDQQVREQVVARLEKLASPAQAKRVARLIDTGGRG